MGKTLRVIMIVVVIVILLLTAVAINFSKLKGLYKQIFKPEIVLQESEVDMKKVRYPNLNRTTVKVGESIVKLLKNDIEVDGKGLGLRMDFGYEPNSLAVVGKFAYCQNDLGLLRVSLEDPNIVHTLFYDVYDFVAVGKDALYVFREGKAYKVSKEGEPEELDIPEPSGRIYEIFDDMMVYENISNKITFVNLTGNDTPDEIEYQGQLRTYNITEDNILVIKTDLESKEINLVEMADSLRPEQSRMENPDFVLEPKEVVEDKTVSKTQTVPAQEPEGEDMNAEDQE